MLLAVNQWIPDRPADRYRYSVKAVGTNALYAAFCFCQFCFLNLSFVVLMFRLRKPRVLLASLQTSVIWASQRKSAMILTEAVFCLRFCTQSVAVAEKYCDGGAVRRLVMFIAVPQFCRWKDIFQSRNSSLPSLFQSLSTPPE